MFRKGFEDWCRDNEKRETLENVILFGELLLIDLNNRLDVAQQSVHPTKGGLVLRACVNGECGWVGKESRENFVTS